MAVPQIPGIGQTPMQTDLSTRLDRTHRIINLRGWVPESDINGVSLEDREFYLADCSNADFSQGFLSNAPAPSEWLLPATIKDIINTGAELISSKHFVHTVKGNIFVIILWDATIPKARFFVIELDNSNAVTELNIDEQNSSVTYTTKPTKISYCSVNDEFKINTNCPVTYTFNGARSIAIILNLNLSYESIRTYHTGLGGTLQRSAGWYLTPRWLGALYGTVIHTVDLSNTHLDFEGSISHGAGSEGFTYDSGVSLTTGGTALPPHGGTQFLKIAGDGAANGSTFGILTVNGAKSIDFWYNPYGDTDGLTVTIQDNVTGKQIYSAVIVGGDTFNGNPIGTGFWNHISIEIPIYTTNCQIMFSVGAMSAAYLDDIYIYYNWTNNWSVLAKYSNGQRGLLQANTDNNSLVYLNKNSTIRIQETDIDWRVVAYELYMEINNIFYLIFTAELGDLTWAIGIGYAEIPLVPDFTATDTLNFNYALGNGVRVDTQRNIYSEVIYHARSYYVCDDYKVYFSNIAGSGKVQPDSYPYNESVEFGYMEIARSETNKALALTSMDELVVITNIKNWIFYIESSSGIPLKILRAVNGGAGILNSDALIREVDGSPSAEVLGWLNYSGMFIYGGGIQPPKNVTIETHRNYWRFLTNKETFIAFYNRVKNEFWIITSNEILIYDLAVGGFRKYYYPFTVTGFIGTVKDKLYLLSNENKIYQVDYSSISNLTMTVESHYDANTFVIRYYPIPAPTHMMKILQEIYVSVLATDTILMQYTIITDGNEYPPINMRGDRLNDNVLSYFNVRYGKIKIRIMVPPSLCKLAEFGYSFTVPPQGLAQHVDSAITGLGMSTGLQTGQGL